MKIVRSQNTTLTLELDRADLLLLVEALSDLTDALVAKAEKEDYAVENRVDLALHACAVARMLGRLEACEERMGA